MDRSFSSVSVSSPFSKSRSVLSSTSRRTSRLGGKLASVHIITKSVHNVVERFGSAVPVQVEEVFGFSDKNAVITARLAECGYIWVVCGRRLYIWQYQQALVNTPGGSSKKRLFPHCYELQLPQSDLAHRAALVAVYTKGNANYPCCVAVSPEGMVRYWPDISHEHISVDFHLDLQGQECDSLVDAGSLGCVIVTTTCTVVLVQPKQGNYGPQLSCRTLKTPGTWLGGISKRMSSIFFGPSLSDHGTETKTIKLLTVPGVMQSYTVYVLAGSNLQKWLLYEQEPEKFEWNTEVDDIVKDAFRLHIPSWDLTDPSDISAWIVDIQSDREGVLMLAAAANTNLSPKIYFAMISICTKYPNPPTQIGDFLLLNIILRDNNPAEALSYRFILSGRNAYLYNSRSITVIKPQEEADTLDFNELNDQIFGGAVCLHIPVFFSRQHGLIAVSNVDSDMNLSLLESSIAPEVSVIDASYNAPNNLSVYQMDPEEVIAAHKDTAGQLKAAFIFHVTNQVMECNDIVNTLFPRDVPVLASVDSPLDLVVVKMSKHILDDIPAGDPRWTQTHSGSNSPRGLGSSHAMQVLEQLIDKQKAQALFIRFLKDTGLWDKLAAVSIRETVMATICVLGELSEKITAATVMKSRPPSALFEEAIDRTVKNYGTPTGGSLSRQDIFYREVSRIQEGILWLSKVCEESTHSTLSPVDVAKVVHEANDIMINVVMEVLQARNKNADVFYLNELAKSMGLEFLPWTAAGGAEGIADALMLQHSSTLNYGLKIIDSGPLRDFLIEDFVRLTDILIDGRKTHLASVKPGQKQKVMFKQYCTDRNKLIQPLVEAKCYEQATMLAEKYLDFETLITICEETKNEQRLETYMHRFKDTDFAEYVYSWYLKRGKHFKLLNRHRKSEGKKPGGQDKLSKFLEAYPNLSWIQQAFDEDYSGAAKTLLNLAENEIESITMKKTMFSLSKLARLADKKSASQKKSKEQIKDIDRNLELIAYQESIPDYVLHQYGYDSRNPKVLSPKDIIALYTCPEYTDSTELDFKKALDVAAFLEEEEDLHCELILQIWRAALLRDSWNFPNLDAPLECLQNTLFFRLADLAIVLGADPTKLLPPIDMLIDDSSLKHLTENKNFLFLLKTGYEHFYSSQMI